MSALVEIEHLDVGYRRRGRLIPAVQDVSLSIAPGETVALVGGSGSGKTTLASAVLGLLPAEGRVTAGRIRLDGQDVTGAPDRVQRRLRGSFVGLVPQDPMVGLDPTQRIGAQVAEAVRRRGVPRRLLDAEVLDLLADAGLDQPVLRARQYPHELSGGLRQRVLIAIALAGEPRLIIADEPTSALDVTVQRRILDHLEGLVERRGLALLMVTHDLAVAADRADRLVVMEQGRVVETGPAHAVLAAPAHPCTRRLLASAPALALGGGVGTGGSTGGRPDAAGPRPVPGPPELLRLEGLTKDFALPRAPQAARTLRAVDDVTLTARRGQTLAVVGESGSGKTTLLRMALGLEQPTSGRVRLDGVDLTDLSWAALRPLRRRFQLVQQNPFAALDPKLSVLESLVEPLVSQRIGTRASRLDRARELLDQVSLPVDFLTRRPAELSGGQRQRVAIARALAVEPELLFLDEPVSALDVTVQSQVLTLLGDLQVRWGLTYVFVSHDLAVVSQIAHQVAVLRHGRVVEQGPAEQVLGRPEQEYTRDLLDAVPGRRGPRPTEREPQRAGTGPVR